VKENKKKINILFLLTPKADLSYLRENQNIRQAIEKMRAHNYSAIPMLNKEGIYCGSISLGDLLWYVLDHGSDMQELEKVKVIELVREEFMPAVSINTDISKILHRISSQNYIPVVDDRGILTGIVTRSAVISYFNSLDLK